jgi:hypothetical protein
VRTSFGVVVTGLMAPAGRESLFGPGAGIFDARVLAAPVVVDIDERIDVGPFLTRRHRGSCWGR